MTYDDDLDDRGGGGLDLDPRYWFWVLRRRLWLFLLVAVTLAAGGVGVAMYLPPVFQAKATLLVESQQIPEELVQSTVSSPASEQIAVIRQRLLTRETLLELSERHRVFAGAPPMTLTERVDAMRQAISFRETALGDQRRRRWDESVATAFTIMFTHERAAVTAAVVNDLVDRVLSRSAALRRDRAETTSAFFRQDVDRLARDLAEMESRIVAFKEENEEALPESVAYRRNQLDLLQERLQRFEMERVDLQQERSTLELLLGVGSARVAESGRAGPSRTESARELDALRRAMAQRRAILSESHPEIRALASRIAALEKVVEADRALRVAEDRADAAEAEALAAEEIDPETMELRRRLALVEARLEFNAEVIDEQRARRDELERSLLATPNIQMELNALDRAYRDLEERYETARRKLAQAEAGEQLEDKQQGERFEVIERASVPETPVKPNRKAYAALGVGGGVGAGLGLVVLLELMGGVLRRPEDLARIGREPAAVIPYIVTEAERRWRWTVRIGLTVAVVGGGAAALWAVHTYYLPLETVFEKVLEKAGLDGPFATLRARLGL